MRVSTFAEIEPEFVERAHGMVWCDMATVGPDGRPRTRIIHPIWNNGTAWITSLRVGPKADDIDWLIPHQANIRIMQSTAKKLKLAPAKLIATVDRHGNTSAASIPLALDESVREGKIKRGDTVMLEGVGGGFTWGSVLLPF